MSAPSSAPGGEARLALTAGVGCYLLWGLVPVVFQILGALSVKAGEILAHRIVWALPVAFALVLAARQGKDVLALRSQPKTMAWLALSAALITINWLVFIWAVNHHRILDTSLGYYINPLLNMALGALMFGDRLGRLGYAAVGLATIGVVVAAVDLGGVPLISLALALTFTGYGLVRKQVSVDAQTGLLAECLLLAPFGLAYVVWLEATGQARFEHSLPAALLLLACGPLTGLPLALFAWAARRMPLSALAFVQFITPSITFGLGVSQGESFSNLRAASFALIWAGVAVFLFGAWRRTRVLAQPAE
jgi:chloramphenicol-sensitive protein RarD